MMQTCKQLSALNYVLGTEVDFSLGLVVNMKSRGFFRKPHIQIQAVCYVITLSFMTTPSCFFLSQGGEILTHISI